MNNWLKNNQWLNLRLNAKPLFSLLLKQNCILCATPTNDELSVCHDCMNDLPSAAKLSCPQCGLSTQGDVCGKCIKQPPHFDATHALFTYAYPVDALLQHYKYRHALYLSQTFAQLLSAKIQGNDIDIIIPMPLHPNRLKERGFNQSLEVAKIITNKQNIALDSASCSRIKNTPPQASLPLKSRLKNMKNAFQCSQSLTGKHIALIDDVMTTGTSLNELAKTIKRAGAHKVSCYVLARAQ